MSVVTDRGTVPLGWLTMTANAATDQLGVRYGSDGICVIDHGTKPQRSTDKQYFAYATVLIVHSKIEIIISDVQLKISLYRVDISLF
jgi:hypothetical protein